MLYQVIRSILFLFDAEKVHHFTFWLLQFNGKVPGVLWLTRKFFTYEHPSLRIEIAGLKFKNRVGLAAGFDKDAKLIHELSAFGFGCIEIGTLTPLPQPGNDKPRLFRLPADNGLINRMGFNNGGAMVAAENLRKIRSGVIVGGNIGKNKITPNDKAVDDYRACVNILNPFVDYFVVNVSSPNTPGLRDLQDKEPLKNLLTEVKILTLSKEKVRPVFLKIAPDLTDRQLDDIILILKETKTDGVIAVNTTLARDGLISPKEEIEKLGAGGLSGKPLGKRSTAVIAYLRKGLGPNYPIIGVGGIMTPKDALEKIQAGADLIQVYTGFVYQGPAFVRRINKVLMQ
jgi:dihydroorotate dehydrogenase